MADKRYSIQPLKGQKLALNQIFNDFMQEKMKMDKIKGAVMLIREARQVLQAEQSAKIGNDAVRSLAPGLTPNGPFPRLIKPDG